MTEKILANFSLALEAVLANKLRSMLTALGIIFGVAAVIAMLGIGAGAQQEILDQIRLIGVNNIVISPVVEQTEENLQATTVSANKPKFSPGLRLADVESIKKIIPGIAKVSPEIILDKYLITNGIRRSAKLVGVNNYY
ncbi:MAG: ABC transporter permease, partial [Tunicatimonas sp.]|uniref:ABC transporter permease n=1 Tax=Tunicatimonas sp. TaxID=1940096 RepID=UPI003C72AA5B